jgi:endonuclease-8
MWACEVHPWARIGELKRAECRELLTLAQESLLAHMHYEAKNAISPNEMAVYGRQGKSCQRCNDLVRVAHHGEANRVLYWCPGCQTGHQPLVSPNFTPLSIDRTPVFGDSHPASHILMNEFVTMRGDGQDSFN